MKFSNILKHSYIFYLFKIPIYIFTKEKILNFLNIYIYYFFLINFGELF